MEKRVSSLLAVLTLLGGRVLPMMPGPEVAMALMGIMGSLGLVVPRGEVPV
jgi:hypothetical protein